MDLYFKTYQYKKIKKVLKKKFIFFSNGANCNHKYWISTEQIVHKLKFNYYKTYNKTALKIINNSIYKNIHHIIHSTFFFITPQKLTENLILNKTILLNLTNYNSPFLFSLLCLKLNTKLYSINQIKNINSLIYRYSINIFYQFLIFNLKKSNILRTNV